jgi:hypothetical protein
MKKCMKDCIREDVSCENNLCRFWINYSEDKNCSLITIEDHGALTLKEVGKRLNLSAVRIKQIQDKALENIRETKENQ